MTLDNLRTFFSVSVALSEASMKIAEALGKRPVMPKMHQLHNLANAELQKEYPNMGLIHRLLEEMEIEAKQNAPVIP